MQTVGELLKLLSSLDPNTPLTYSFWSRPPGERIPPRRLDGPPKEGRGSKPKKKLNDSQLVEVRVRAISGENFTMISKHFHVHRATISRYIQQELKAQRMGKMANGSLIAARGAYDLESGLPVNPPVDKKP